MGGNSKRSEIFLFAVRKKVSGRCFVSTQRWQHLYQTDKKVRKSEQETLKTTLNVSKCFWHRAHFLRQRSDKTMPN
jgi:hypothetical protein